MLTSSLHGRFSPPTALAQMPPDGGRRGPKSPAVLATSTSISAIAHAVIRSMIYYMRPKLGETNPQNARCGMLCVVLAWPCVMDAADCRFFSFFFGDPMLRPVHPVFRHPLRPRLWEPGLLPTGRIHRGRGTYFLGLRLMYLSHVRRPR